MATIKFQKPSSYFNNPGNVNYFIDGQLQTSTFEGTTEIIEVGPGFHTLSMKNKWISSPELQFNILYNETKTFEVGVTKAIKIYAVIFVLMLIIPLLHSPEYFSYNVFIPTLIILLVLLYATIRRRGYFTIKEI